MARTTVIMVTGLGWLVLAASGLGGQVKLDGSFGPGGPLTGPNYTIPATLGKTVGNNLFQSFSQFDLSLGDVAKFTGPPNIHNVISRVTGKASFVDGTIQCTIAGANFFLINPFGVMFGPDARVDVDGSFAVTTADYVKLADGGRFDARNPANDVLTAAPVSAFGFLGPTVAPITMQGPSATTPTPILAQLTDGKSFVAIGGDVHIDNFQLTAPSGRISLIGVGSAGEAVTDVDDVQSPVNTVSFSKLGKVSLTTFSTLDVSGDPGGRIDLQAEDLTAHDAAITANSEGSQDGFGIYLFARDALTLRGEIEVSTESDEPPVTTGSTIFGAAGAVSMTAKTIILAGEPIRGYGAVNITTDTYTPGNAGDISIHADALVMRNGVVISGSTEGAGTGGNVDVAAKSILMQGEQSLAVISTTSFDGQPGNITINTDNLTLRSGGQISSSAATDTPGGNISVNARSVRLFDGEIMAQAGGNGGNVQLNATSFVSLFDSQIAASSVHGDGGDVTMDPPVVALNHSVLTANAINGNGGHVDITSSFFLRSDTMINVSSVFGVEGTVTITAPDAHVSGSLLPLTAEPFDAETMLYPDCAARLPGSVSSFTVSDRGGIPIGPEALLPSVENVNRTDEK